MDDHTLRVLEFNKILEKAASWARSAQGRERLLAVRPMTRLAPIRRQSDLVSEIKNVLVSTGRFPLDGIGDIRAALKKVRPDGAILDGGELLRVASCLTAGRTLREVVTRLDLDVPRLVELISEIRVFPDLEKRLRATLDEEGVVVDTASPALRQIRRTIREIDDRIRGLLENFIHSPDGDRVLQEKFFTLRDGRHVLPVKANDKGEVPGIIHGRSDTGNTVYIEPTQGVELGNERRDLAGQEAAEVRRILLGLTAEVRAGLLDLEHNLEVLSQADAACAMASFSIEFECRPARFSDDGDFVLRQARHPLLLFQGIDAVPLDLEFGDGARGLVVSGPNTGGKTVALKTLGLCCVLAQSGLHVPAGERSTFPLFQTILADIGDDQSIEASLSTFSSHIARIGEILAATDERALVLLDEMGAATDPGEGAALACAVLDKVHGSGAWWIATTHLSALKVFAHGKDGADNAAMTFDDETGRPTYRLHRGIPGSSRALATAQALGLPSDVVAAARRNLGAGESEMENLLQSLRREAEEARSDRETARQELAAATAAKTEAEEKAQMLESDRKAILRDAHAEAASLLQDYRRRADAAIETIAEIRREAPAPGRRPAARKERRKIDALSRSASEEQARLQPPPADASDEPARVGGPVALRTMPGFGVVQRLDEQKGRAQVAMDGLTFDVALADLIPLKDTALPGRGGRRKKATFEAPSAPASSEVHLLGMRVEEALDMLGKRLDDAVRSDLEALRVVHGFGTGALQKAVADFLRKHPSVASFREGRKGEGGAGATVVTLA